MPKAIIAGGRHYVGTVKAAAWLDALRVELSIDTVISGCATGADAFGEKWADRREIKIERFPADWYRLGKSAGPIRNEQMANAADICILFPGGTGTADMKRRAIAHGLIVREYA